MKEPLTKSISVQELLHMREEGMSNSQIASSLEVSVATIRKYIGASRKYTRHNPSEKKPTIKSEPTPQPKTLEQPDQQSQDTTPKPSVTDPDRLYGMKLISNERIVELEGRCCQYTVRMNGKTVSMYIRGIEITLDEQQCKWVARELGNIFGMFHENERQKLT